MVRPLTECYARSVKRFFFIALALLVAFGAHAQQIDQLKRPKAIGYSADRCRYEARGRRATCTGHVVVRRSDLRIACDRLEAEMDSRGRVIRLSCQRNVEIVTAGRVARSDTARYNADDDRLVLDGNARVAQGKSRLAGESIAIDLETGDVRVEGRVRGVLGPDVVQTR